MWRAALPCKQVGIALLGSIVATALVVGASPSSSAAAPAATAGQVWAVALPDSAKTVELKQMRWLAARGVTTIVAFKRPQASLTRLAASAKKSGLVVIAPHPDLSQAQRKTIALDYGMVDSIRVVQVRRAFLLYFLQHLRLDDAASGRRPPEQQIVLANRTEVLETLAADRHAGQARDVESRAP